MGELMIKTHNFQSSKNQLKVFSEQATNDLELSKVDICGGIFNWGDHKVTGYELNSLTTEIQDYLIDYNKNHIKLIKEFGQVYNALEALDKDYIQAILIAIKSAEKANIEVNIAQGDITKTVEVQKKTINVLNQFKVKLEQFEHLKDIDVLWKESETLNNQVLEIEKILNSTTTSISNQDKDISLLLEFKDNINSYEHLIDIDNIWNKCNENEIEIISSSKIAINQEEKLNNLVKELKDIQKGNDEKNQNFAKKLKQAYFLASGSIIIVFITFILLILKVI